MKKILTAICLILLCALFIVSCDSSSNYEDNNNYNSQPNINSYDDNYVSPTPYETETTVTEKPVIETSSPSPKPTPDSTDCLSLNWVSATCTKPKTCLVCGTVDGDATGHHFVSGFCTACNEADKNSNEYKYALLKKKADGIAFSCAKTVVRGMLKNPSTMEVLNEEIIESDDYFRYYIKLNYSAMNNLGGTVTDYAYVLVRVNPKMDGTFYYTYNKISGIKFSISQDDRMEWGWETEPDDWNLNAADKYANPTEVSIKLILSNPSKYKGQYVKIKEQLVISSNSLSNSNFYVYQSTGNGKRDFNTDNSIYVFYRMSDNVDDCIILDADYQKITVIGEVNVYSDSTSAYIEAYEIIFE